MKKLKLLVFSYAFPPFASPRSIQVCRLITSLDATVVVVCGDNKQERQDESITLEFDNLEHLIRVPFYRNQILKFLDRVAYRFHLSLTKFPDPYRRWIKLAGNRFFEWQNESGYKPDVLVTFGMPMSDHFFGIEYKKRTGIPWIAHFSDPWAGNSLSFENEPLTVWLNSRMERKVISKADAVVFTSPETVDFVMNKYPASWLQKAYYIPHCYDMKLFDNLLTPNHERYVLRSIGSFYHPRSPKPFFDAVEVIAKERPELLDGVEIEFVGYIGIYKDLLNSYQHVKRFVRFMGIVSYAESLRMMQTANCLLIIDAPADISVFFPSKLVEYIGANRFIFAISPKGATARIVKEIGGKVANPSNVDSIVDALKSVLKQRPAKLSLSRNCYDRKSVADEFMKIVDKL